MRVLIVENMNNTSWGQVGVALSEAGAEVDLVSARQGAELPSHDDYDGLVVFGGEQTAVDDEIHPYLPKLAALMGVFGDHDKPVLGICLGSQLLARAHGAANLIGQAREFGWRQVQRTEAAADDPVLSVAPDSFSSFQWHGDTFSLPDGAVRLAQNATTPNQCFRIGRASYGMQFHFEASRTVIEEWNAQFPQLIGVLDPDWLSAYPARAATEGAEADNVGLDIARAWVSLIRSSKA
jgi:GMP synthase (glutamine-hydrolysing)